MDLSVSCFLFLLSHRDKLRLRYGFISFLISAFWFRDGFLCVFLSLLLSKSLTAQVSDKFNPISGGIWQNHMALSTETVATIKYLFEPINISGFIIARAWNST